MSVHPSGAVIVPLAERRGVTAAIITWPLTTAEGRGIVSDEDFEDVREVVPPATAIVPSVVAPSWATAPSSDIRTTLALAVGTAAPASDVKPSRAADNTRTMANRRGRLPNMPLWSVLELAGVRKGHSRGCHSNSHFDVPRLMTRPAGR
jgi:hypothetical protein